MNFKSVISTLSFFLLFACNDNAQDSATTELINLIESNQQKWASANISTYTFTYYSPPNDCPTADAFPAVEITIEQNVITKLYLPGLGKSLALDSQAYPTINDVFQNMINAVEHIEGIPLFDATFGYPTSYKTDRSKLACDGYSITISSFI